MFVSLKKPTQIIFVFNDQMEMNISRRFPSPASNFMQKMFVTIVLDRVDGVKTKAVDLEILDPVKRILDDKLSDVFGFVVVAAAPGGHRGALSAPLAG